MAFRRRGRGRGGFARGFHKRVPRDEDFFRWNTKLQNYFENSAYFVEVSTSQDCQSHDIERYSDSLKPRNKRKRESLFDYMKLQRGYFPQELVQGVKLPDKRSKVKWKADADDKKLDMYEALERRAKDGDEKDEDDEEENDGEEDDEEYSDDGDYGQNEDFDDDDDDFNDNDDGDDEPFY